MASTTKGRRSHHHDTEGCSIVIAQDVQEVGGGEGIRLDALREANIFHSSFFNSKPLCPPAATAAQTSSSSSSAYNTPSNERLCLGGHRETIFGISFSPDGVFLATASQDSTIAIWSVESHRLVATLKEGMNVKYECLRVAWSMTTMTQRCNKTSEKYLLASAGADGIARLWSASAVDPTANVDKNVVNDHRKSNNGDQKRKEPLQWQCAGTLDHYAFEKVDRNGTNSKEEDEEDEINDRPQIYALQFIRDNRNTPKGTTITNYDDRDANNVLLLTSANDCIYLWNIVASEEDDDRTSNNNTTIHSRKEFRLRTKIQFSHVKDETRYNINTFGGERNPDNAIYVFDASCCEKNGWLGVALSDGTCRVSFQAMETFDRSGDDGDKINSLSYRERCVLGLPPNYSGNNSTRGGGHLTALSWDTSGTRLATCFASGRVVLWSIRIVNNGAMHGTNDVLLQPSLISVLEGGHDAGRPLFGAKYCGGINEDLLLTWGVDGRVCLWDSYSIGEVPSPLCTLISQPNYPIYALDLTMERKKSTDSDEQERQALHVMAIGGGVGGGFCGVPVYLYDIFSCVQIPDRIS